MGRHATPPLLRSNIQHPKQIHIRKPPDDPGGGIGSLINLLSSLDDGTSGPSRAGATPHDGDGHMEVAGQREVGVGVAMGSESNIVGGAFCAGNGRGGTGAEESEGSCSLLSSESPPSEVFYSMKLVTGKDAVGTLSGPGTLGIDRCNGKGDEGGGVNSSGGRGGGGRAACGGGDDKRSAVQALVGALSWGKGDAGKRDAGREAGPIVSPHGGLFFFFFRAFVCWAHSLFTFLFVSEHVFLFFIL